MAVKAHCLDCNKQLVDRRSKRCRSCATKLQMLMLTPETRKKMSEAKMGSTPWNKGIEWTAMRGVNHHNWKGDRVGYNALHTWVSKYLGKPEACMHCKSKSNLEWASISHEAKRDIEDYMPLCRKCHAKYDDYVNKSWKTRKENIERGRLLFQS